MTKREGTISIAVEVSGESESMMRIFLASVTKHIIKKALDKESYDDCEFEYEDMLGQHKVKFGEVKSRLTRPR